MASKVPRGFSLIELIVSIAIIMLLVSGLISSYGNYNQNQIVKQAAQTVKANVLLSQSKALSAVKPVSGCTELLGYSLTFTQTTYAFQALCVPQGLVGTNTVLTLPQNLTFSPVPSTFTFGVLTKGLVEAPSAVTISISGFNKLYQLVIDQNGTITDSGFQ